MQITFISFIWIIFPRSSLHCMLVPVQFREYENDLLIEIMAPGFFRPIAKHCHANQNKCQLLYKWKPLYRPIVYLIKKVKRESFFFTQTVDAIALQMCLECMEPSEEDVKDISRRQAWCDLVLSVQIPVEEMIRKSSTGGEARIGEKTESIITQCRYDYMCVMSQSTGQSWATVISIYR